MAIIYFGAIIPTVPHTGDWKSLNQWYSQPGYSNKGGSSPGVQLGRFPDYATDTIYIYQNILSNVSTYFIGSDTWSTDHTYPGLVFSYDGFVFNDPLAIYSGSIESSNSTFTSGTILNPIRLSNVNYLNGASILGGFAPSSFGDLIISNAALDNLDFTIVPIAVQLKIILTLDDIGTSNVNIGSYNLPVSSVSVSSGVVNQQFTTGRNFNICRTATFSTANIVFTGLLTLPVANSILTQSVVIENSIYSPTVNIPIKNIKGGSNYTIDTSIYPKTYGFGVVSGTFSPIIKLSNVPKLNYNLGAATE